MAKAKSKVKDKPKKKVKDKRPDEGGSIKLQNLRERSYNNPYIRILLINNSPSLIEPHLVPANTDCVVRISVFPATASTGLTVTLTDIVNGTETSPAIAAVGTSNKVHAITIAGGDLPSGSQFILRIQIGTTTTVAEITLQTYPHESIKP